MITRFNDIGLTGKKRFKCECGKRIVRQKRFSQTLNPFNRKPDGFIKTQGEILTECRDELIKWTNIVDPCTHIVRNIK